MVTVVCDDGPSVASIGSSRLAGWVRAIFAATPFTASYCNFFPAHLPAALARAARARWLPDFMRGERLVPSEARPSQIAVMALSGSLAAAGAPA
ncbi:hypothetical protein CDQ92_08070 [Sphingopyxis bauzanensis]|uniref:Uncharacterized protein n=1 Tax=Sphingopyxis bauzanensis TaxID=651663 RepID=A0A246JVS5_9SPHN|nr:hypothetical protein [Sphingopyxis bauzanensis]OWQ97036.1 hypothetical protein CDQ92_08070 [Sphingopyxis bauzanensis]GGJ41686.1 hypothetical protein GCM10011393_09760 [Sphingopyxis bauzanensis]